MNWADWMDWAESADYNASLRGHKSRISYEAVMYGVYKFRLDPSTFRPHGSVNFSRIDTGLLLKELELQEQQRRLERDRLERASATKIVAAAKGWLYRRHFLWNLDTDIGSRYMKARIIREVSSEYEPGQ